MKNTQAVTCDIGVMGVNIIFLLLFFIFKFFYSVPMLVLMTEKKKKLLIFKISESGRKKAQIGFIG